MMAHMVYLAFGLLFTIGAAGLFGMAVYAQRTGRSEGPAPWCLGALALIFLMALLAPTPVSLFYKAALLLSLLAALLAEALMLIPGNPSIIRTGFWLVIAFLYLLAFASQARLQMPSPWLLVPLAGAGALVWLLYPSLGELRITFLLIVALFLAMIWQAVEMSVQQPALWSWLALGGALLLAAAASLAAIDRLRAPVRYAPTLVSGAFYAAQWLVALSLWYELRLLLG